MDAKRIMELETQIQALDYVIDVLDPLWWRDELFRAQNRMEERSPEERKMHTDRMTEVCLMKLKLLAQKNLLLPK